MKPELLSIQYSVQIQATASIQLDNLRRSSQVGEGDQEKTPLEDVETEKEKEVVVQLPPHPISLINIKLARVSLPSLHTPL